MSRFSLKRFLARQMQQQIRNLNKLFTITFTTCFEFILIRNVLVTSYNYRAKKKQANQTIFHCTERMISHIYVSKNTITGIFILFLFRNHGNENHGNEKGIRNSEKFLQM